MFQGSIGDSHSWKYYVRCSLAEITSDLTLKHTNILYLSEKKLVLLLSYGKDRICLLQMPCKRESVNG